MVKKRNGYPSNKWQRQFLMSARLAGYDIVHNLPADRPLGYDHGNVWGDGTVVDGARDEPPNFKWLRWRATMYYRMGLPAIEAGAKAVKDLKDHLAGRPIDPPELTAPPKAADDQSVQLRSIAEPKPKPKRKPKAPADTTPGRLFD
jgi:hypothetical protein